MKLVSSKPARLILTALPIALFLIYFRLNQHNFTPLLHLNIALLLIIFAIDLVGIFSNGVFIKLILLPFKKSISYAESFYISLVASVGNFFAPVGAGFGFRGIYLKQKHGLDYADYISILSGNYIIVFLVSSSFGLLALWLLRAQANPQYYTLLLMFAAIFVGSIALSVVKLPGSRSELGENKGIPARLWRRVRQVNDGWRVISNDRRLMLQLIAITAFNVLLTIVDTKIIVTALHLPISFASLLLLSTLGSLSLFVNITPANLGVKEAIYIFSSSVVGFSTAQLLSVSLIDRAVLFSSLFILWLFFARPRLAETS